MQKIEPSGLCYPNKFALIWLTALEEVMGKNGLNAILNLAGQSKYINNYPPDNLDKEVDMADITAWQLAVEELYGRRGGRGLALRAGRTLFSDALKGFGAMAGVGDLAFKVLPLQAKLKVGLPAVAGIFRQFSDQVSYVLDEDDRYIYTYELVDGLRRCPMCQQRDAEQPVCFTGQGLLQEALRWVSGGHEFKVDMVECMACGDSRGAYHIYKEPIS
ncbi:MAG: 4-vinyl reductase [Anaerolineae bacterium]|nr:4-vinyl reductase [Anaerolineae bacterium]